MNKTSLVFSCFGLALWACGSEGRSSVSGRAGFSGSIGDIVSSGAAASDSAANGSAADAPGLADSAVAGEAGEFAADLESAEPADGATEPPGPEPVRWRPCGHVGDRNISCAEVYVPLDHADPEGEQLAISLNRVSAQRALPRRGVLLFNPGGPGVSGKDSVLDPSLLSDLDAVAPGFDIVGFDPRGIAQSGDRACAPRLGEKLPYGAKPSAGASSVPYLAQALAESRRCTDTWGPVFNKLGSNQVAHDLDWLRRALGEAKLNFLGASYGTRLGALYAHYYPETTGAIVLDAVVSPTVDWLQDARGAFDEQRRLTGVLLDACEADAVTDCPTDARAVFGQLVSDATELGVLENLMGFWNSLLASPPGFDTLVLLLAQASTAPDPSWLLDFAGEAEAELGLMPLATVNCIDAANEPPSLAQLEALYAEFEAEDPAFKSAILRAVMCAGWPVTRDPVPLPVATDAPPVLVIGGANDWRTPFAGAVAMTEALGSARLLTSKHFGHGAFVWGGECPRRVIRDYLIDGVLPEEGTVCDPYAAPSEAAPEDPLWTMLSGTRPSISAR